MVLIKVIKSSIRKNPNAGRTSGFVAGRTVCEDGIQTRDIQRIHWITPEANYICEYENPDLECSGCHGKFKANELRADSLDFDTWSNRICPYCGKWDCCEFEFEKLEEPCHQKKLKS